MAECTGGIEATRLHSQWEHPNIRLPGQYYDKETERWDPTLNDGAGGYVEGSGLHYNRFRYYDPAIGRYVSADPIGQFGIVDWKGVATSDGPSLGPLTEVTNAESNLYGYAGANPGSRSDPSGLGFITAGVCVAVAAWDVYDTYSDVSEYEEDLESIQCEIDALDAELESMEPTDPGYLQKLEERGELVKEALEATRKFSKERNTLTAKTIGFGTLCAMAMHPGLP